MTTSPNQFPNRSSTIPDEVADASLAPEGSRPIRLAAVDDHPIFVEGVVATLRRFGESVEWLGAAENFAGLKKALAEWPQEIMLVDLHLGDGSTPDEVVATIAERGIKCIILTSERRPVPIRRAVAAGAVGLILKSDSPEKLVTALREVRDDNFAVSSDLAYTLVTDQKICAHLSPRETEILELLAEGFTRRHVARSFTPPIAESTVATHLERIFDQYRQLGRDVRSTVAAIKEAARDGYVDEWGLGNGSTGS